MSTNKILSGSIIAAFGIAGLAMTADAQSRYGNVYDYESGHCGSACAAPAQSYSTHTQSSRYGSGVVQPSYVAPSMPISPGPVYVDCRATGTCAPQPQTVYSQPTTYSAPVQSYQTQSYQTQSYQAPTQQLPAECPAGTTPQSDGTCMQSSYSSTTSSYSEPSSYGSGSSYSSSSSSYSSGSSYSGTPTNCPAGTTAQSDGTCMETSSASSYTSYDSGTSYGSGSSYSDSSSTSSSYGSGSSYGGSMPTNCPAGTTAQSDGTCMEGGSSSYSNAYTGSSVELFTGDATATPSYGYGSDGSFGATDYSPIRK